MKQIAIIVVRLVLTACVSPVADQILTPFGRLAEIQVDGILGIARPGFRVWSELRRFVYDLYGDSRLSILSIHISGGGYNTGSHLMRHYCS